MDVDAVSKGTGKGRGSETANLSKLWETWTLGEKTVGRAKANTWRQIRSARKARTMATRAKDLEVPRVYLGLRTLTSVGSVETPGRHTRDSQFLEKVKLVKFWTLTAQRRDEQQLDPDTGSTIRGPWLWPSEPPLRTVTFGFDRDFT